jgi:hypothetical protein
MSQLKGHQIATDKIRLHSGKRKMPINRRLFLKRGAAACLYARLARAGATLLAAESDNRGYYKIASAVLPRQARVEEVFPVLERYRDKGFTGVWIENDYLRWSWNIHPDQGFNGNWMLFNIFDFTMSTEKALYQDYLSKLCGKCVVLDLKFYGSFWLPKLNTEMRSYLREHNPDALGSCMSQGKREETLCTCADGTGLAFLERMVGSYLALSPAIRGLKVATLDNSSFVCDETCPHAHGSTQGQHVGNLYASVQRAMRAVRPDAELFVYEWFWEPGYLKEVQKRITEPYFLLCKIEIGTRQHLEAAIEGAPLFDASDLTDEEGGGYKESVKAVGADRVVEMPALGSGNDDFFFGSPPIPGRLHRRMLLHRKVHCDKLIEFDCGGHWADSNEEAYAVFNAEPGISQSDLLKRVAARIYKSPAAQALAIDGWLSFDEGFSQLPIGIGETNCAQFSGRFGFARTMCIATPLVREAFGDSDQRSRIHWFSPYNFFNRSLVDRLEMHFLRIQNCWQRAAAALAAAAALEGDRARSSHESVAAQAHVLGVASALNWCDACRYARDPALQSSFVDVARTEMDLTRQFLDLSSQHDWVWNHICWHPHQTPMSQQHLGFERVKTHNTFEAKLEIMQMEMNRI